ncbi:MAG: hypothetical protein AAF892_05325 [Cyanobacteria bacterium P01_D01_bin.71]
MSSNALVSPPPSIIPVLEISGLPIEVGVLPDGTPFMSGRELARACGISNSTLVGWGEVAPQLGDRHRAGKLAELLATYRYEGDRLFMRLPDGAQFAGRTNVSVYPYQVCLAFLDYYAFEASKPAARDSLRLLNEKQLPQSICAAIKEPLPKDPLQQTISPQLDPFRHRPLRNGIPVGYFEVGQVLAEDFAPSAPLTELRNARFINIDKAWNRYWNIQQLSQQYGDRLAMPQHPLNDWARTQQYVYPAAASKVFQEWLVLHYLPDRYPSYLQRKWKQITREISFLKPLPQAG